MRDLVIVGVLMALGTGVAVGVQTSLTGRSGGLIGPVMTGLLTNLAGGLVALVVLVALAVLTGVVAPPVPRAAGAYLAVAGALGPVIVAGVALALGRIGVTAGMTAALLGQLAIAVAVDALGLAGGAPVPVGPRRLAGLAVMAVAVWLLVPRGGAS